MKIYNDVFNWRCNTQQSNTLCSYLAHLSAQTQKIFQKEPSRKKKIDFSSSNIKKILIFSQKKAFFIFPEIKSCTFQPKPEKWKKSTRRKFFILQETQTPKKFILFQEMETLKAPYIPESNFQNSKSKTFLIFREMKLSFHKLKKLFIFHEETLKSLKQTKNLLWRIFWCLVMFL